MAEAKLAPNLPDWMVEHANRYLDSGGADGHMYKVTVPQRGEITAPALLLTTTGRKSGDKFIFPLFYGTDGGSYFVIASKGGAPEHPGWYRNILANPNVEVQVGTKKMNARARTTASKERLRLWRKGARILAALRRLSAQDRTRDTGGRARSSPLGARGGRPPQRRHGAVRTALSFSWLRRRPRDGCIQRRLPPAVALHMLARREEAPRRRQGNYRSMGRRTPLA
jgi:deazaflavin-dependent oxidoreductase (nitroreductase family)